MHHGGKKDFRHGAWLCPGERRLRDADDLENVVADAEGFAEDAGILLEAVEPVIVGNHGEGMRTGSGIVIGCEKTTEGRLQTEG
jgi:hypothetical protein